MIESFCLSVRDRAVGEQRGITTPAGIQQLTFAAHIQKRFLLAGEAGIG
jgi:hypothetical protein